MKYFVAIGESTREVVIDGETVTVDGKTTTARVAHLAGTPLQVVTIGTETHQVIARRGERRSEYDISIDGFRFSVEALDERARTIKDLSGATAKPAGPAHLMAPMPGLIVRVNVTNGAEVRAGQGLVVMEAMKMENELRAAVSGVVRRVLVAPGSAVEKGALLLEME